MKHGLSDAYAVLRVARFLLLLQGMKSTVAATLLTLLALVACGEESSPAGADGGSEPGLEGPAPDAGTADAAVPDADIPDNPALEDEFTMAECQGLNGVDLPCYWRYQYDDTLCSTQTPCDKLVIYYSGGGMVCDDGVGDPDHQSSVVLREYASNGYVAVCANIHLDKVEVSFLSEAERVDRLQKAITSSSAIQSIWTGEHLLLSGVSHGATAPVVAMAHTDYDDGSAWKGTKATAACFLDGVYDMQVTYDYLSSYPVQCKSVKQSLMCNRYFDGDCDNFDDADADFVGDSTAASPASAFAIKNWKLIECGSALPGCLGDTDWIPAAPIASLCANIDAGENHECVDDPIPDEGHLSCSTASGSTKCRTWFSALVQ